MTRGFSPPASGLATVCQPPEALEAKQSQVSAGFLDWLADGDHIISQRPLPAAYLLRHKCEIRILPNVTTPYPYIRICHRFRIFAAPNRLCALLSLRGGWCGRIPTVEHGAHASRSPYPGLSPLGERSVGMANEGVDWALSFADGAERADDGPDVNAQAPGPASTQRAGAKEKASQEPKTVRPRTRPVPACIHPRSRVYPPTTRPSPRTRAVSTTHPPRSPRCRSSPTFSREGISLAPFSAARGRSQTEKFTADRVPPYPPHRSAVSREGMRRDVPYRS